MLLLHGMGASSHIYDELLRLGRDRYRFLRLDFPQAGASGRFSGLSPEALARWLRRFLESVVEGPLIVVGHSFGGVVGIELAARAPSRVKGLAVISSPALGIGLLEHLVGSTLTGRLAAVAAKVPMPSVAVRAYLRRIWGEPERITDAHVRGYVNAMKAEGAWPAMLEAARHLVQYRLPIEKLRAAAIPCTVLWGERDPVVPVVQGERLARTLGATFRVLPATGHCVPEERPEAVLEAIDELAAMGRPKRRGSSPRARRGVR